MIALGLDYGTTNSLVAIYQNEMQSKHIRKVHKTSSVYNNGEFIRSPKRLLNKLQDNQLDVITSCIDSCVHSLLGDLRCKMSEKELDNVNLALTVPNAFKDNQCDVLKKSILRTFRQNFVKCTQVSLEIIPEPVAAALYYAYCLKMTLGQIGSGKKYIIVSDMGGGTTDLAVVRMEMKGNELHFKVIATEHDSCLGGDDVDLLIAEYLKSKYELAGVDERYIIFAAQNLKKKLSANQASGISSSASSLLLLDNDYYCYDGEELEMTLDAVTLENLMNMSSGRHSTGFLRTYTNLLEQLRAAFIKQLNKDGYNNDIDEVLKKNVVLLPVGGSSRLKLVQDAFSGFFRFSPVFHLKTEVSADSSVEVHYDSVVRGAAIYSAYRSGILGDLCNKIVIENRTFHNISVRYSSDKVYTCVKKSMPDDLYTAVFNPKMISPDGKKFSIGALEFYQGGNEDVMDKDCVKLATFILDDTLYTNGKQRDEIKIILTLKILNGRLHSGSVIVPDGNKDGSDYEKVLDIRES